VRETARDEAGRPVTRSRTWQVIGSLAGAAGAFEGIEERFARLNPASSILS